VPWSTRWGTAAAKASQSLPINAATGRRYSGITFLFLWGQLSRMVFPATLAHLSPDPVV
jgi:antirestriction protein ArdC